MDIRVHPLGDWTICGQCGNEEVLADDTCEHYVCLECVEAGDCAQCNRLEPDDAYGIYQAAMDKLPAERRISFGDWDAGENPNSVHGKDPSMTAFEKVVSKVTGWIGLGTITEQQLKQLVWAMAMDRSLERDLVQAAADERNDYERELRRNQ